MARIVSREDRPGFCFYYDWGEVAADLVGDEKDYKEAYFFIQSINGYARTGEDPESVKELTKAGLVAYHQAKKQLDRDWEKYREKSEMRSKCGEMGGRPKKEDYKDENPDKEQTAYQHAEGVQKTKKSKSFH